MRGWKKLRYTPPAPALMVPVPHEGLEDGKRQQRLQHWALFPFPMRGWKEEQLAIGLRCVIGSRSP